MILSVGDHPEELLREDGGVRVRAACASDVGEGTGGGGSRLKSESRIAPGEHRLILNNLDPQAGFEA